MTDDSAGLLLRRDQPGVAWLTLNRPAARNALSVALMAALQTTRSTPSRRMRRVRVVVIGGAGPAFCAGHDLRELRAEPGPRHLCAACSPNARALMQRIVRLPKPVIARVHGVATAAGCQLVASCDLAVAADDARFATPGVNIGLFCSTPMVALSRAVGAQAGDGDAADRRHDRRRARRGASAWSTAWCRQATLDDAVVALAGQIAAKSATDAGDRQGGVLPPGRDGPAPTPIAYAAEVMTRNMMAHDAAEGIDAFLAKRAPVWTG